MNARLASRFQKVEPDNEGSPVPLWGTLIGSAAFLLYGGFSILQFSRPLRPVYPWFNGFDTLLFWIPVVISLGTVAIAWAKNFPRWSYPFVAMSLLFSFIMCFSSAAGCLPLLFTVALSLLVTRSAKPLFHLFDQGLKDWTVFAFGAFGTLLFWMEAFCDLAGKSVALPWMIALTLFATAVAALYLRSPNFSQRSMIIRAGLLFVGIAFVVGPDPFQYKIDWIYIGLMIFVVTLLLLVSLFPALLVKLFQYWTRPQNN